MRVKRLLVALAAVVLIVAAGCGGSSGGADPGLGINLDEVAGNLVAARYRSPGVPCDHTLIPEESGGPGLSVSMVVHCRQSEITPIMRRVQSGLAAAAGEAGLPIVEEKELHFDGHVVAFTLYFIDGDASGTIDGEICDPSATPSRHPNGDRLYELAISIRKPRG